MNIHCCNDYRQRVSFPARAIPTKEIVSGSAVISSTVMCRLS